MTTKDINFWLNEKELKTPKHDEMVLWCFNNAEEILKKLDLNPKIKNWTFTNEFYSYKRYCWWNWETRKAEHDVQGSQLEEANKQKKQIEESYLIFTKKIKERKKLYEIKKELELNLSQPNGWNIGFIDVVFKIKVNKIKTQYFEEDIENIHKDYDGNIIYLEIKPEVKSIGEVMRQINYYRNYTKDFPFILVTQTQGIKEVFESQNVLVYEYKPLEKRI